MARVVVVGGGMGGLATALFAARRGHDAVVVDRGVGPPDGPPDVVAAWDRRGVAQAAFSHYFLARSTRSVREEAADLLPALRSVGIGPAALRFGPGFEDDVALTARRPLYEAVLHRFVERERNVELVQGSVRGLLVSEATPPRVVGARLDSGEEIDADLVVDAGGRRTASGRWLRDAGLPGPVVEEEACDSHYYCRHYRLDDGASYPADDVPLVQPLPYAIALVFIGDNRTFSVAVNLSARDPLKERLQDPAVFDRFLRALPLTAAWLGRAEPIGDLRVMAGLSNRRRRLVVDGRPLVTGLALVGDACQYTNPALGQGVSLSFWMAQRLAASLERLDADPAGTAVAYEAWIDDELGPRFERQLRTDREVGRQLRAGLNGEGFLPPRDEQARRLAAIRVLSGQDEEVGRLAARVGHLLVRPSAYAESPAVAAKVEAYLATDPPFPDGQGPLPRRAFDALVSGAA